MKLVAALVVAAVAPAAADSRGELVDSDLIGTTAVVYNASAHTTTTIADRQDLTDYVGLHYYVADHWRVGLSFQFTEQLNPAPTGSRFQTFALLPQVGWTFSKPFFAALIVSLAPRTGGHEAFDAGFRGVIGAGIALTQRMRLDLAVQVPVDLVIATTIGIAPLVGLSVTL
jgi:hypothetical protein